MFICVQYLPLCSSDYFYAQGLQTVLREDMMPFPGSEFQRDCVIRNGVVLEWFHGIISRKVAEEMLLSKPTDYFLFRVSESRIGYTLSYRATDCCRPFRIDVLQDLVNFHCRVPVMPFNELLTVACGQVRNYS
ncbi:unnamed protein product [Oncorhynchus mykiss]|uniref:SH2 domain-containing protein n=1 Tax=Oncorhynchus mykiss TaxID=8022 RepID=A0A060W001_ONCMY|nr:unnamed protein product [Oncorhynchus mykiss]